jgi:hypothetical protein
MQYVKNKREFSLPDSNFGKRRLANPKYSSFKKGCPLQTLNSKRAKHNGSII